MADQREPSYGILSFNPEDLRQRWEIRHHRDYNAYVEGLRVELLGLKNILESGKINVTVDGVKTVAPMTLRQEARRERAYFTLRRIPRVLGSREAFIFPDTPIGKKIAIKIGESSRYRTPPLLEFETGVRESREEKAAREERRVQAKIRMGLYKKD